MKWLDRIPLSLLVVITAVMALAPFGAEPHLWQKLKMFFAGSLVRPIDMLDLFFHGAPAVVLVVKLARVVRSRPQRGADR